jgi:hypothetical protein
MRLQILHWIVLLNKSIQVVHLNKQSKNKHLNISPVVLNKEVKWLNHRLIIHTVFNLVVFYTVCETKFYGIIDQSLFYIDIVNRSIA